MVLWNPPRAAAGNNAEPELQSNAFNWISVHITVVEYVFVMLLVLAGEKNIKSQTDNCNLFCI